MKIQDFGLNETPKPTLPVEIQLKHPVRVIVRGTDGGDYEDTVTLLRWRDDEEVPVIAKLQRGWTGIRMLSPAKKP